MNGWARGGWGLAALAACGLAQAECVLRTLEPQGSEVHAGDLTVNLGEADDPARPTAWQGPLVAGACRIELGIIEPPLALGGEAYLLVPTYSGSVRKLSVVDLKGCSVLWESAGFSGGLKIGPHGLELGGKRVELGRECLPLRVTAFSTPLDYMRIYAQVLNPF